MKTVEVIVGLQILQKYRDKQDGFGVGAEHDVIYVYKTVRPVEQPDLDRLIELGWFQEDVDYGDDEETDGDFAAKHYDSEEGWTAYV